MAFVFCAFSSVGGLFRNDEMPGVLVDRGGRDFIGFAPSEGDDDALMGRLNHEQIAEGNGSRTFLSIKEPFGNDAISNDIIDGGDVVGLPSLEVDDVFFMEQEIDEPTAEDDGFHAFSSIEGPFANAIFNVVDGGDVVCLHILGGEGGFCFGGGRKWLVCVWLGLQHCNLSRCLDNYVSVVMSLRCSCSHLWLDKKDKGYVYVCPSNLYFPSTWLCQVAIILEYFINSGKIIKITSA